MKHYKSTFILNHLLLIFVSNVFLTSCLKDKLYDNGTTQSVHSHSTDGVVEITLNAQSFNNFALLSFDNSTKDTTIKLVPVSYGGVGGAPEDIKVTLTSDNTLVDNYNNNNGTQYSVVDPSKITILNGGVVTILKGSHTGYLQVKFNPSNFLDNTYALGFTISKVEPSNIVISQNTKSGVIAFGVKNKYDGRYTVNGTLIDYLAPGNSSVPGDPYPLEVDLITSGPNSVAMYFPGLGYAHPIAGGSAYGEFTPVLTFDASGAIISVTNYYGQPSPTRKRSAELDPTGANKQNPDKSIDVKYVLKQAGNLKASFDEHLTYIGPR